MSNGPSPRAVAAVSQGPLRRGAMCSYFIHIADTAEEEAYGRESLIRYFHDALISAFPADAKTVPPTYAYFVKIVEILRETKKDLPAYFQSVSK